MSDMLDGAGAGTVAGGLITWLISYIKHKDMKEEISKRVHKDTYKTDHDAMTQKIDTLGKQREEVCSIKTDSLSKRLDAFGEMQIRMEVKIDKLLERGV